MSAFVAERAVRAHAFHVDRPIDRTFPLFTPEGEKAWAEGWSPTYVHPADGRAEPGMVFTTAHGGEETIWMVVRYEPAAGLVEYARVTPGSRIATVLVQCASVAPGRTRVNVVYTVTGLGESGNEHIRRAFEEGAYRRYIDSWEESIRQRG